MALFIFTFTPLYCRNREIPYGDSFEYKDGITVYCDENNLWGAVDRQGNQIIECKYEELTSAGNEKIGFKQYGLWGYLDYGGNVIIEPQFENACDFRGGVAQVTKSGSICFIDTNGSTVFQASGETGLSYYENGIIIDNYNKVYDSSGNLLLDNNLSINSTDRITNSLYYYGGKIIQQGANNNVEKYYKVIEN